MDFYLPEESLVRRHKWSKKLVFIASMNLGHIADTLGYADAANFTRAFLRWTGRSPSQYRAGAPAVTIPLHPVNLCQ